MEKARPVGRTLRLLFGFALLFYVSPIYFEAGLNFNLASLGVAAGLTIFYIVVHYLVSRYFLGINPWAGALIALIPVNLVFVFGLPDYPLFGQGEGAIGAMTFIGISLIINFIENDPGCEVMAIPGVLLRKRTHLVCITLSPVDILETKLSAKVNI